MRGAITGEPVPGAAQPNLNVRKSLDTTALLVLTQSPRQTAETIFSHRQHRLQGDAPAVFDVRYVSYLTHRIWATALIFCHAGCDHGMHPVDGRSDTPSHCWGVANNEIATSIAVRSPVAHIAGDVAGTCRLPKRCPRAGRANTGRAVEWG
jgi:hypothetical protein